MTGTPSPNPYAPPQVERLDAEVDSEVVLRARFLVDERWQRKISYDLIMPGALLLTSSILVLGLCMLLGALLTPVELGTRRQPSRYLLGAALVGFPVGACAAIAYHVVIHQWLKRKNLERLRSHPALQALGEWVLEVDAEEFRVHTSQGVARWPVKDVWWHPARGMLVLVQVPGPIPIGVPRKCEVDPPRPGDFARLLRQRVQRVPFT